jgi:CRP-like cAMP-binding protein
MEQDLTFAKAVIKSMAMKIRRMYHQLSNTSNSMRLDKQIASKLWKLSRDFGKEKEGKIEIDFDLSITYLADMVGSKRETVSRIVKQLSERQLIEVNKNRFIIVNAQGLHEFCKE